jgi:glycosylphosphatidylinositol transamidase (GPIT) subunit GPI8
MRYDEAAELLQTLQAAYDKQLEQETIAQYLVRLARFEDSQVAAMAVDDVIQAERFFPSPAVINEAYNAALRRRPRQAEVEQLDMETVPPPAEFLEMRDRLRRETQMP